MDVARLAERIGGVDIATASPGHLQTLLADLRRLRGFASAIEAHATRRLSELEAEGLSVPTADVLARANKTGRRAAERAERRAHALAHTPTVEQQLAAGRISDEHADALANAAGKLTTDDERNALFACDDELATRAAGSTPAQFTRFLAAKTRDLADDDGLDLSERQRQLARCAHGTDDTTGLGTLRAELHPDDYQRVKTRLDAEVKAIKQHPEHDGLRSDQLAAVALVNLITGARAVSTPPPEVTVFIDLDSMLNGLHARSIVEYGDGTPLPVETARRLACSAKVIPVVLDSKGMPLDVGRGARHATPAQRQSLRSMYRTCAVDGCTTSFDRCEIHHIIEWAFRNGATDLDNLLPLCSHHHHRCHEGRRRLQLEPSTRQLSVFLPNGTLHSRALPDIVSERAAA